MAEGWSTSPLGELTINFDSIRVPVKESERKPGPYPYYGASGIVDHVDGWLFDGEYLLVAEDGENLRTRQTPVAFMATGKFWVNNHAHIIKGNAQNDTRFLMYALRVADIAGHLTGSAMPKLTQGNMNRIPVIAPSLPEQRAIAGVLGALDDKIELNRRTSRTLDKLARAIFRAWFVDFEPVKAKAAGARSFPGMPQEAFDALPTRLVPSELGPIPEGWKVRKVGDCITRHSVGKKYDQKTVLPTGNVPVLDQGKSGIIGYHNDEPGVVASVAEPKIVFANHTCYMRLITFPFSTIQNVLPFTGKDVDTIWIYYATLDIQPFIEYKGHWPDFVINEIIFPPREFAAVFRTCIHPMIVRSVQLDRESRTLASLRDYLLPKLLSGEVRAVGTPENVKVTI